ncbi:MAG: LysR family transcriptional regulator [Thermoleophilaceae bacterium]
MLDLRRMRALREVASHGSLSAAAESLGYTQPAISQQIAALEREVGARLLERGTRPIKLTDAGRALVAHADAVLARLDDAEQELEEIKGVRAGRLRLASFSTALASLVPRALAVFTERHPHVRVSIVEDQLQGVIGRLGRWELDLGLIYEHEALPEPEVELERIHLFDEPFELLLPHRHRFARRRALPLDQLTHETWIGGIGAYHSILHHSCQAAGFEPRVAYRTDDYRAIQAFVAAGLGVAILPRLALALMPPRIARVAIQPRPPVRRISAARLTKSFRSPATETMVRVLVETAAAPDGLP